MCRPGLTDYTEPHCYDLAQVYKSPHHPPRVNVNQSSRDCTRTLCTTLLSQSLARLQLECAAHYRANSHFLLRDKILIDASEVRENETIWSSIYLALSSVQNDLLKYL